MHGDGGCSNEDENPVNPNVQQARPPRVERPSEV